MKPEIEEYLGAHAGQYTRDALRRQLLDAGHEAAEVDAALDEWTATEVKAATTPGDTLRGRFWRWTWGIYGVVWLATLLLAGPNAGFVAVFLGIVMLIGVAITGLIGRAMLSSGLGAALIVPIIGALLLGGSCVGLIGGFRNL